MTAVYATILNDHGFQFGWNLSNWPAASFGSGVAAEVRKAAKEQFGDLSDLFPFSSGIESKAFEGEDYICVSLVSINGTNIGGTFTSEETAELEAAARKAPLSPAELVTLLGSKWFSSERFTYIGPFKKPHGCWQHVAVHLGEWLNRVVLPDILERNRRRIHRALPRAPTFNVAEILNALWVLESRKNMTQGTGFLLEGLGLVTNSHVLADDLVAFRADSPRVEYPVKTVKKNDILDLAVLRLDVNIGQSLRKGSADKLNLLDQLMVAGFPNYRYGDTGIVSPGLVTGFRTVSGVRRVLTNALIIAGNSGGPVIGAEGSVIGIAVTGADSPQTATETENYGIIPVDAINCM